MRILQLTNKIPIPARDGGAIATLTLARGLAHAGNHVTMLAMNTSKHHTDPEKLKNHPLSSGFKLIAIEVNTTIRPIGLVSNLLFSKFPYNGIRFYSENYKHQLEILLNENSFDLIIVENLYPVLYLETLKKLSQAGIVIRSHNVEHEIWERNAELSRGLQKWYTKILSKRIRLLEQSIINEYDALVTITKRDLEKFNQMGNIKPSFVLPAGIDSNDIIDYPLYPSKLTLGHLGALDWLPNQFGILWFVSRVWPTLAKEFEELTFDVAGRNAPESFKKEINTARVRFMGEVEDADEFMMSHSIAIVPLFSGSGMRIKIIENMAKGRVVVTTSIGAEGIGAVPGRDLIIADDEVSMTGALRSLLNSPERIREIGENAITFVRNNYDNRLLIERFQHFLTKIADSTRNIILDKRSRDIP